MIIINHEDINKALNNVKNKNIKEGRALIIAMYSTGAKPSEILKLKGKDVQKEGNFIIINVTRQIKISISRLPLIKELYEFSRTIYPDLFLFQHYISKTYIRKKQCKNQIKEYKETTNKLRYYFKKWFCDLNISPYHLRHNRFLKMFYLGATIQQIQHIKGTKKINSVIPYLQYSKDEEQKSSKFIN